MIDLITNKSSINGNKIRKETLNSNFFIFIFIIYDYFRCKYILKEYIPLEKYYTFKN